MGQMLDYILVSGFAVKYGGTKVWLYKYRDLPLYTIGQKFDYILVSRFAVKYDGTKVWLYIYWH